MAGGGGGEVQGKIKGIISITAGLLYPQTKVWNTLDSGQSRRCHRIFLVYAITQKWISIFFQTWYTCLYVRDFKSEALV